jgi:membrane associated rhomboid family serine protease
MRTASRRSPSFNIPGYNQNAVLQLIIASGSGFIMYHLVRVTLIVFGFKALEAQNAVMPYVALPAPGEFFSHFWTIFTYGWIHNGLMEWISGMVWLYCFGNALQMLVNYKQIIPIYIYGILGGGAVCLLGQYITGYELSAIITGQAGVMALVAAIITLSPNYRFYLGENFSVPLLAVAGIYLVLTVVFYPHPAMLMLDAGGLLTGFIVMSAIKKGMRPGEWMYAIANIGSSERSAIRMNKKSNKGFEKHNLQENRQKRIDDILDKINQRGYNALTKEERELLVRASQDDK